jgi:Domain of unknown function (DUF892)
MLEGIEGNRKDPFGFRCQRLNACAPTSRSTKMGLFTKDIKSMEDLFIHTLQDVYYAENQIVKSLPKMIEKATNRELASGLRTHHRPLPSPQAHANPRLTSVGELHPSGFENLLKACDGTGSYFFASLEANDCLGSHPGGDR